MVALIKENIDGIRAVCKQHHVKSLYLFGSAASESNFSSQSDVDFLYEIDLNGFQGWDNGRYDYIDNLNDLEIGLGKLLSRKIDLISRGSIHNRFFREAVNATSQLIYGSR